MPMREPLDFELPPFESLPARLRHPLLRCARGELPANVALTHLFMASRDSMEAKITLDKALRVCEQRDAAAAGRLRYAQDLWERTPNAFAMIKEVTQTVDHDGRMEDSEQALARWADSFDRIADVWPIASIALYSLGRPDLLRATTEEVLEQMRTWGLLTSCCEALEIGCGNGRVLQAVAPKVRFAIGIDISIRMLSAASRVCADAANAAFIRSSGRDLRSFGDVRFDLVYAIDSFPYLVQSGLAPCHVHEAARVLKPGGHLLILNFSYRNDPELDRADIARLAREAGLSVIRNGTRDLGLWDALSFLLQKSV